MSSSGGMVKVQNEATINPEDVRDDTDISVAFSSVTIFSRIAMEEEGMKMMQADMMTESEFLRDVRGIDDLEEFRQERALDKVRKANEDMAVALAKQTTQELYEAWQQAAMSQSNLAQPPETPAMVPTNGQMLRSDRGPGMPVGPGQAMPAGAPTPPQGGPEPGIAREMRAGNALEGANV